MEKSTPSDPTPRKPEHTRNILDIGTNKEHKVGNGTPPGDSLVFRASAILGGANRKVVSMLAIAISLLFGFATFGALAVIHASLVSGTRRARHILAELAEIERAERALVTAPRRSRSGAPALAAA